MSNLSLDQKLSVIGIRIANADYSLKSKEWVDIEETLYQATLEVENSGRLFMLLCSWVKYHGSYVVIEKLLKLQKEKESKWLIALAIFAVKNKHRNWKTLVKKVKGENSISGIKIAKQSISYKGEEKGFRKYGFFIPKGSIRIRESDIAQPERLIKENHQYRNRLLIGANWRSDIITAIQKGYENPNQISKAIGCSYPSAYYAYRDYKIIQDVMPAS